MAAFCSSCGQSLAAGVRFCGQCGAATEAAPATNVPVPSAVTATSSVPRCQTCHVGALRLEKKYRMSTPVVAIGYIILVPSALFAGTIAAQ